MDSEVSDKRQLERMRLENNGLGILASLWAIQLTDSTSLPSSSNDDNDRFLHPACALVPILSIDTMINHNKEKNWNKI